MNFVHFRVFTLISKNLEEDINKRNHENEISELQRKHQYEIAELQRKHALEVQWFPFENQQSPVYVVNCHFHDVLTDARSAATTKLS